MAPHPSLRDTLSPKGEGEVTTETLWGFLIAIKGNSNLALRERMPAGQVRGHSEGPIINIEKWKRKYMKCL